MKVQVIYSSLSGRTKKVAEAIYEGIKADEKSIHNLKDGEPQLDGDIILLGYWVDKGGPNEEMKALLPKIEGKAVGIFCTLGYYADSTHAANSVARGLELVKDKNEVIGSYVCNGALSAEILERMRAPGNTGHHSSTPANEIRWDIMKDHPTNAELALAAERFAERVDMYRRHKEAGIDFKSIL